MANSILAVSPHPSNTVSQLAHLINTALQERCEISTDSHEEYHQALSTLTGLGFTAVLAEGSHIWSCRPHMATYLRYRNFSQHPGKLEPFSHAIAEITCRAISPFKALGHPLYYDDFISALVHTLKSSDTFDAKTDQGIKEMMQTLFEKHG